MPYETVPNCREALSTLLGLAAFAVVTLTCMWSICVKFANADAPHTILVQPTIAATDVASFELRLFFYGFVRLTLFGQRSSKKFIQEPDSQCLRVGGVTSSHRDVDITEVTSSALSRLPARHPIDASAAPNTINSTATSSQPR